NLPHIEFAANELRHDEVLMIVEDVDAQQSSTYSQAIQLERGWNLVSWYVWPTGDQYNRPFMDDIFEPPDPLPPEGWWFNYNQTTPVDKVGRYDRNPIVEIFYPQYGHTGDPQGAWEWDMKQAYMIYLDEEQSSSHFWEITGQPDYDLETYPIEPSEAWDDWNENLQFPSEAEYWYFLSYPLRKSLLVSASVDLDPLFDFSSNRLYVIKDDQGNWYNPNYLNQSKLQYLEPGKGYFLGFPNATTISFGGFTGDDDFIPDSSPPKPGTENNQTMSSASHFQCKTRTHWFYPIEIDTIAIEGFTVSAGDEVAVFDGDLCVGVTTFDGTYPVFLAAWKDDIATEEDIDGYDGPDPMIFKVFDVSENSEITFTLPPQTASVPEEDLRIPTHSGFGIGFYAKRSLSDGQSSVTQLPMEYSLAQNYPNPFNSTTVIPLQLPQRSRVTVKIFDVTGRQVWSIQAGIHNAGQSRIHYNASRLASGVYFYCVEAEGLERGGKFQGVGKMLLLK
ncbi:T9SS type A sorting domain-containing protein, partial [bacterium]|nr:T9SS type A sorting domain-containing protein [bacterium]